MTPSSATPTRAGIRNALPTWLHASDIQGFAQLATQGVLGVTNLSEVAQGNVYKTVAAAFGPMGRRFIDNTPGRSGVKPLGITGVVYGSIRGVTQLAGGTAHAVLRQAVPFFRRETSSPQREAMLAAVNGVLGDHLLATANPLAISMHLRQRGKSLVLEKPALAAAFPQAGGKLLVTLHGLCMNDLCWQGSGVASSPAEALVKSAGYTQIDLHYNTGLHTFVNGAQLALLLDQLLAAWPQPVEELTLLAHSMGGLVARSACHQAEVNGLAWRARLRNLVFLGTPHHGAPLEQIGAWVGRALGSNLVTLPFARIGQIRSSGITDLRHGRVLRPSNEEAESGLDAFDDQRQALPLPEGVRCLAVAGRVAGGLGVLGIVGDGLVPLASAFGQHAQLAHQLHFGAERQWVADGMHHMALLTRPEVGDQLIRWLGAES